MTTTHQAAGQLWQIYTSALALVQFPVSRDQLETQLIATTSNKKLGIAHHHRRCRESQRPTHLDWVLALAVDV